MQRAASAWRNSGSSGRIWENGNVVGASGRQGRRLKVNLNAERQRQRPRPTPIEEHCSAFRLRVGRSLYGASLKCMISLGCAKNCRCRDHAAACFSRMQIPSMATMPTCSFSTPRLHLFARESIAASWMPSHASATTSPGKSDRSGCMSHVFRRNWRALRRSCVHWLTRSRPRRDCGGVVA